MSNSLLFDRDFRKKWHTVNSRLNYQLKENEVFDSTHNQVLCKHCGMPLRILTWSDLIGDLYYESIGERCPCELAKIKAEEDQKRMDFIRRYYSSEWYVSEIKMEYRDARLHTIPENHMHEDYYDVRDDLSDFVNGYKPGGKGVAITGNIGLGKSTLMACLRNEFLDRGYSCAMATVSKICENVRNRVENESFSYNTYWLVDVLILDDIGADFNSNDKYRKQEYNSTLFSLVNDRNVNGKTICYTSNLSKQGLIKLGVSDRAMDRMYELIGQTYTLEGESIRQRDNPE